MREKRENEIMMNHELIILTVYIDKYNFLFPFFDFDFEFEFLHALSPPSLSLSLSLSHTHTSLCQRPHFFLVIIDGNVVNRWSLIGAVR